MLCTNWYDVQIVYSEEMKMEIAKKCSIPALFFVLLGYTTLGVASHRVTS